LNVSVRSGDEIADAIRAFTDAQWIRLRTVGDQAYAIEELVAELGAAFLCADLGITDEPRADHAQYLATWLSVLKADKKAIFTAASKASEAAAFLTALQAA
jgi:antirestriction protein ArdC